MSSNSGSSSSTSTSTVGRGHQRGSHNVRKTTTTVPEGFWSLMGSRFNDRPGPQKDFSFIVGTGPGIVRCRAHKNFLQVRTPELAKLVEDSSNNMISLPDADPRVFPHFLEFLYKEEFLPTTNFTSANFIELIALFSSYCPDEENEILVKMVSFNTVFKLAIVAKAQEHDELIRITSDRIQRINKDAKKQLETADFLLLDSESVCEMIQSDELNVDELSLFNAVVQWAQQRPGGETLRQKMRDVIRLIRFPLLKGKDITRFVRPLGILTAQEMANLLCYILEDEDNKPDYNDFPTLPDQVKPRQPLELLVTSVVSLSTNVSVQEGSNSDYSELEDSIDIVPGVKSEASSQILQNGSFTSTPTRSSPRRQIPTPAHAGPSVDMASNDGSRSVSSPPSPPPISESLASSTLSTMFDLILRPSTWRHFLAEVNQHKDHPNIVGIVKDCRIPIAVSNPKVLMPNLECVRVEGSIPIEEDEEEPNELIKLRRNFDLEPYIFFTKRPGHDQLWSPTSPDFELVINDVRFFKLNRAKQELLIGFGGGSAQLIPHVVRVAHQFRTLILSDMDLPLTPIPSGSFKQLMLWGVRDTTPSSVGAFLQKFKKLQKLSLWVKRPHLRSDLPDKPSIDFGRDLVSGRKLTRMSVCGSKLTIQTPLTPSVIQNARKENLTELYTDASHWNPIIFEKFHELFPSLKRVAFGFCGHSFTEDVLVENDTSTKGRAKRQKISQPQKLVSSVSVRLMTNILKITSMEYIRVRHLDWNAKPVVLSEGKALTTFINRAGLLDTTHRPYNFVLEKNPKAKGKSGWKGIPFNERENEPQAPKDGEGKYWEEMDQLEYKFFELVKIFRTFEAFEEHNVQPSYDD